MTDSVSVEERVEEDVKKSKKDDSTKKHKNTSAVFRIKSNHGSNVSIKYKGVILETEKLGDEIVELDDVLHPDSDVVGKHAIPIKKIEEYDMIGRIYRANIIGSHIVLRTNYPVMYLSIQYNRSIVTGSLLQIYLSIRMDREQKKAINQTKRYEKYNDMTFSGTWNLTIECDDELKDLWREKIEPCLRDEAIREFHDDYEENIEKHSMTEKEVLDSINQIVNEKMKWYEELMRETVFNFRTIKRARNFFIELSNDVRFHNFLKIAMDCRVIQRRNEQNISEEIYQIPDNVTNLADLRHQMVENNELILSDSD